MGNKTESSLTAAQQVTTLPQALILIDALREALYDTVVQLTDARMRLRGIEKLAEKP